MTIFFEIEGTLTNAESICNYGPNVLDKDCVENLNTLVEKTNAELVVFGSFTIGETKSSINKFLKSSGLKKDISHMIDWKEDKRYIELDISIYIENNDIKDFLIIDTSSRITSEFYENTLEVSFNNYKYDSKIGQYINFSGFSSSKLEKALNFINNKEPLHPKMNYGESYMEWWKKKLNNEETSAFDDNMWEFDF